MQYSVRRKIHLLPSGGDRLDLKKMAEEEALWHIWRETLSPMMLEGSFYNPKNVRVRKEWITDWAETYSILGHPTVLVLTLTVTISET